MCNLKIILQVCVRMLVLVTMVVAVATTSAMATDKTFSKGSYIIGADSCWQPNNDPSTTTGLPSYCDPNKNDKSLFQLFGMLYALLDVGDDPGTCLNTDGSTPQQKALFGYCKQIKVNWIIDNSKTDPQAADLTISDSTATATKPIITIYNSTRTGTVAPISTYTTKANSGTATSIAYRGGPFVIDASDITAEEVAKLVSTYPSVKIHKVNDISFTGNVDKVLMGKPPKVAVLNEGASDVLEDYIRAAGAFAWRNTVFQYVDAQDILNGCLEKNSSNIVPASCNAGRVSKSPPFSDEVTAPFQLLWAPHWEIEKFSTNATTQKAVISKIRDFLQAGNSGFFECASIESMEGSQDVSNSSKFAGKNIGTAGGFTVGSTGTWPRIQTNGGCSDTKSGTGAKNCTSDYLKYEQVPFWLTQCGGWRYQATGGHVHNMRPTMPSSYKYLTTVVANATDTTVDDRYIGGQISRFIHDDETKLNASYSAGTSGVSAGYYVYDYLVGGRINGSPSQGYIVYLPGHSYVQCSNAASSTTYPPSRTLDFVFNATPLDGSVISIEVVHASCTKGSTCPVATYTLATAIDPVVAALGEPSSAANSAKLKINPEFATFDPVTNRLSGVLITSNDPNSSTDLKITDIYVSFDGNAGAVKLTNIADVTEADKRQSICAPNATSTTSTSVQCSTTKPADLITLKFSSDISVETAKIVRLTLSYSGGPLFAEYNLAAATQAPATATKTAGNLTLDMSKAIYDVTTMTLSNIVVTPTITSCADVSLTDIAVSFPGSGTLVTIDNATTSDLICSPSHASPAACTNEVATFKYLVGRGICSSSSVGYFVSPYLSTCDIQWTKSNHGVTETKSNTCGIKYVLNTFLALKYQSVNNEYSKTQPIIKDGIVYTSSYDFPDHRGHLKMDKLPTGSETASTRIWDAASAVPAAGISGFVTAPLASTDTTSPRYIFTTLPGSTTAIAFDPAHYIALDSTTKASLRGVLGATSDNDAVVTINTVRGRKGTSTTDVYGSTSDCSVTGGNGTSDDLYGCGEDSKRLWGIENSTPALKLRSKHIEATTTTAIVSGKDRRDRFLFAGADDGMLHAFWGGNYDASHCGDSVSTCYPLPANFPSTKTGSGTGNGKEVWAYIPSGLLSELKNQPFNPDPANDATFYPKVKVDGSPAINDFLYCTAKDSVGNCTTWKWRTILVGTASINTVNKGIVFALDVSDPYTPQVLWENTYDKTTDVDALSKPVCKGTKKNCNMGYSKGVAIGTAQIDTELKDYAFLTSSWIKKRNKTDLSICSTDSADCVWGVSGYALDIFTGDVIWSTNLPYTATDTVNVNEPSPATPALMDRDYNGTVDYALFGDMQGRLWALKTTDGTNLTGSTPFYQVMVRSSDNVKDTTTPANNDEPIGAPVAVSKDLIVLATGGTDSGLSTQTYRVEVLRFSLAGAKKDTIKDSGGNVTAEVWPTTTVVTEAGEKIWAQPAISNDNKVFIGTAKSFFNNATVSTLKSTGRILILDLRADNSTGHPRVSYLGTDPTVGERFDGGFVGGFDLDRGQAVIGLLKPGKDESGIYKDKIVIGSPSSSSGSAVNPYKILWWRKL